MSASVEQMKARLGEAMSAAGPGLATADQLCLACVEVLGVDGAAISVVAHGTSQGTLGSSGSRSRRVDEYQFTFGEGPCVDAVSGGVAVLVGDLDSAKEQRWPLYAGALLDEGVRAVFAWPIMVASVGVGALGLFRDTPGLLTEQGVTGYQLAAELASVPLVDLGNQIRARELEVEDQDLDEVNVASGLDRVEVYQATGMLIAQLDVDADEAVVRLRGHAVATGQTASEVAWAVLARRLVLSRDGAQPDGWDRS